MFYLPLILAILRFIPSALLLIAGKFLTIVLSPVVALPCFVVKLDEEETTGYPSLFPNVKHEFLIKPLRWMQTHDAPLDEHWYGGYYGLTFLKNCTQVDYDTNGWVRYFCRVFWLCRNPAYALAHRLGYDQKGMTLTKHRDEGKLWDKGYPNTSFWTATNAKGQMGFMFECQWYFAGQRCVEIYLGWKLHRDDPDQRCMLVTRFTPFKRYAKQNVGL